MEKLARILRSCSGCHSVLFTFVCLLALASGLMAQEVTANITGQVTDPTGAAIAGVKVTATDTQRGTQYSAETNADGRYRISNVPVGAYDIKAEAKGFQTATVSHVTLDLNQTAKIDFPMQVGNVSTSVDWAARWLPPASRKRRLFHSNMPHSFNPRIRPCTISLRSRYGTPVASKKAIRSLRFINRRRNAPSR
jgi:hypothetical protein